MGLFDGLAQILPQLTGGMSDMFNFGMQMQNQDYMKKVQEETWKREDNAVQRRSADMAAAGFNPLLAAGAAATSSTPIQVGTPQIDLRNAQGMSAMLRQGKENSLTQSQKDLNDQKYWKEAEMYTAGVQEAKSKAALAKTQADEAAYNLGVAQKRGIMTNEPASIFRDIGTALEFIPKMPSMLGPPVLGDAASSLIDRGKKALSDFRQALTAERAGVSAGELKSIVDSEARRKMKAK